MLGLGLLVLWIVALGAGVTPWLAWLDLVAGLLSLAASATLPIVRPTTGLRATALSSPFGLAVMLLVLWILGLALAANPWLTWWNFVFGVGYGLLGVGTGSLAAFPRARTHGPRTA